MATRIVYHASNSTEATVLQGWLKDSGIEDFVLNDQVGAFDLGLVTDPQVTVDEKDYEKASAIAQAYEAELKKETDMSVVTDAEGQFDWPICPQCDELRHAICSNCKTTGSEFATDDTGCICFIVLQLQENFFGAPVNPTGDARELGHVDAITFVRAARCDLVKKYNFVVPFFD